MAERKQFMEHSDNKYLFCQNTFTQSMSSEPKPPDHIRFQVQCLPSNYRERSSHNKQLKDLEVLLVPDSEAKTPAKVLIFGDSGKSTFVAKYINLHPNYYDKNVIWLTSKPSLKKNIIQLAIELNIKVNQGNEERNFEQILDSIEEYLSTRSALIVLHKVYQVTTEFYSLMRRLTQCLNLSILVIEKYVHSYYKPEEGWARICIEHYDLEWAVECAQDRMVDSIID